MTDKKSLQSRGGALSALLLAGFVALAGAMLPLENRRAGGELAGRQVVSHLGEATCEHVSRQLTQFAVDAGADQVRSSLYPNPSIAKMPASAYGSSRRLPVNDYLAEMMPQGAYQWPASKLPVKVFIEDGSLVPGYRPAMRDVLIESFDKWTGASQGRLSWQLVNNRAEAYVVCGWFANMEMHKGDLGAGKTQVTVASRGPGAQEYMDEARMTLLTRLNGKNFDDEELGRTALHEVGHAFGLQGHSRSPGDIMYYAINHDRAPYLSDRDVNTMLSLYSNYPANFAVGNRNTGRPRNAS